MYLYSIDDVSEDFVIFYSNWSPITKRFCGVPSVTSLKMETGTVSFKTCEWNRELVCVGIEAFL